jgi:hypothetical protein
MGARIEALPANGRPAPPRAHFYLPPSHVPLAAADSELVQFSPSEELRTVDAAMIKNMQAMGGA